MVHAAPGLLRLSQNRGDEAVDAFRESAGLAPDDFFMQFVYGVSALRSNVLDSSRLNELAVDALKRAAALNPDSADAWGWLAAGQMQREASLADARLSVERAIQLAPGRNEYRLRWADIRILQGDYDEARSADEDRCAWPTHRGAERQGAGAPAQREDGCGQAASQRETDAARTG